MKRLFLFLLLLLKINLFADGSSIIKTAEHYYKSGEYYNTITESMRYQHLFPEGDLYPRSMILMGKSYYRGGNAEKALDAFTGCYNRFTKGTEGEEGLYYSGIVRILSGSYYFGGRTFQEYNFVYKGGLFYEDSVFNLCRASILAENYDDAARRINEYKKYFPEGKYLSEAERLSIMIGMERSRDKKSPLVAGLSSAVIPGSGYFYTGNYRLGFLSFITNGALLFLAYDGYRKGDSFQMFFFSVVEFSFYNYSIVGSIKSAQEYNDSSIMKKEILAGIKAGF